MLLGDLEVSTDRGNGLPVTVDLVEELGADGYLYGHADVNGRRTDIVARVDGRVHPDINDVVYLHPSQNHTHVFDVDSGARISQAVHD